MEDIQNKAIQTYQKNIQYLQTTHPEVLKLINILEQAIQNGDYKEKYTLEYVNDGFDIQEISTELYLYEKNSTQISKEFAKAVNYDKNNATIEGLPIIYMQADKKLTDKEYGRYGLFPIMRYYIDNTFKENLHFMKEIKKYIFLGVGLGLHITTIHNKIKAKNYLIIEDDLEFFKLSLFTTKYYEIAEEAKLYFSISSDKENFIKTFSRFLNDTAFDNRFLKFTHFGIHSNDKIKDMQYLISTQGFHTFPYRTHLEKFIRPLNYINDGSYFLNFSNKFTDTIFESKPVLLLAAGPSLQKNIQWVKNNKDNFIIVAVSATLHLLINNDIKPDIVTHVDGFQASLVHFKGINKEFLKDTIAIVESFAPLEVREMFQKENIFTVANLTEYFQGMKGIPATCVGSFTFNILLSFNVKELYLLGLDLALDQESGETHSSDHGYGKTLDLNTKNENNIMNMKKNIQSIEGNFTKEVLTISEFALSVTTINNFISYKKSNTQTIYNLNDGAKFHNTVPLRPANIRKKKIDKTSLTEEIRDSLKKISVNKLSTDDINSMKKRLIDVQTIKKIINNYSQKKHTNSDMFLYELTSFYIELLKKQTREENNIAYVYMNYFNYLLPILIDHFNTKNLKHKKKDVKTYNKYVTNELYEIEDIYEKALTKFLNEKI